MSEPAQSDQLSHRMWEQLCHTHDFLVKCQENVQARTGGASYQQIVVLMAIQSHGRPVTGAELAATLRRNPNSISMILDRMQRQSLIRRTRTKRDRRLVMISITEEGRRQLTAASGVAARVVESVARALTQDELQSLTVALEKLEQRALELFSGVKGAPTSTRSLQGTHNEASPPASTAPTTMF